MNQGKNDNDKVSEEGKTRYGHTVKRPTLYGFDYGLTMRLNPAEERFYYKMKELQELSLFTTSKYDLGSEEVVRDDEDEQDIEELGTVGDRDNYDTGCSASY